MRLKHTVLPFLVQHGTAVLFDPRENQATPEDIQIFTQKYGSSLGVTDDQDKSWKAFKKDIDVAKIPAHKTDFEKLLNEIDEQTSDYLESTNKNIFGKSFSNFDDDINALSELGLDSSYFLYDDSIYDMPEPTTITTTRVTPTTADEESVPSYQELLALYEAGKISEESLSGSALGSSGTQKAVQKLPRTNAGPLRLVSQTQNHCEQNRCGHGLCINNFDGYDCECYDGYLKTKGTEPKCIGCRLGDNSFTSVITALENADMRLATPEDMIAMFDRTPVDKLEDLSQQDFVNVGCDQEDKLHYGKKAKCRIMCKSKEQRLFKEEEDATKVKHMSCECNKQAGVCRWVHNTDSVSCYDKDDEIFGKDTFKMAEKRNRIADREEDKLTKKRAREERQNQINMRKSEKAEKRQQIFSERSRINKVLFLKTDFSANFLDDTRRFVLERSWKTPTAKTLDNYNIDMLAITGFYNIQSLTFEYFSILNDILNQGEHSDWTYQYTPCTGPSLVECRLTAFFYRSSEYEFITSLPSDENDDGSFYHLPTCGVFKRKGYVQRITLCGYTARPDKLDTTNEKTKTEISKIPELLSNYRDESTNNTLLFGHYKFDCASNRYQRKINGFDATETEEIKEAMKDKIDFEGFMTKNYYGQSRRGSCLGFGLLKLKSRKAAHVSTNCREVDPIIGGKYRMWDYVFDSPFPPFVCNFE